MNDEIDQRTDAQSPVKDYAFRVYPVEDAAELRLADLWRAIWRGRWLVVSLALISAAVAAVAAFVMTPVYRAEVVMVPVTEERSGSSFASLAGQLGGIAALTGLNLGSQDNTVEAMATLRSRAFTERFIESRDLMPVLFSEIWDAEKQAWNVDDPADAPTLWKAYERFDKTIRSVSQDVQSGLVRLTVDWTDPQMAADWANGLVDEVNANLRNKALQQSRKNIDYLRKQLEATSEIELRTAVFSLVEAEMKNAMIANVKTEFAFKVIDPAVVPERKHSPNRALLIVLGFSAGLVLGVFATFVRRAFAAKA